MMWRTDRGLIEPTAAAVMWMWAVPAGTRSERPSQGTPGEHAGSPPTLEPDPESVARRLVAREGDALFDPIEFALVGGWAFLNGAVPRNVH